MSDRDVQTSDLFAVAQPPPAEHASDSPVRNAPGDGPGSFGPPEHERVLRRTDDDRLIAGVCAGIGRYTDIDPLLVRLAFVIVTICAGVGVLLYIVAWLVIPRERAGDYLGAPPHRTGLHPGQLLGLFLIGIGTALLLQRILPWFDGRYVWPLVLVAVGALVLKRGGRR